mmetsp:Transcript_16002/g.32172  ORF Transcript_16002/g.32172 Transcript_16002/m.32172 type:complete len:413 (-) Transcript_16002:321-1559(-)
MQKQYKEPLAQLFPYIEKLQEKEPKDRRDQFLRYLKDCQNILQMKPFTNLPPKFTVDLLDRAARFIHKVVNIYSDYLQCNNPYTPANTSNATRAAPETTQQTSTAAMPPRPARLGGASEAPQQDIVDQSKQPNIGSSSSPNVGNPIVLDEKMREMESRVKTAMDHSHRLESFVENELKKAKQERIQNTLAALRQGLAESNRGTSKIRARPIIEVENFSIEGAVIKSKTIFECTCENGLRTAKRSRNDSTDVRTLKEAVKLECQSAEKRNPRIVLEVSEEFGLLMVLCSLPMPGVRIPKLILRIPRGYPRKGGAGYGFERPPLGWIGNSNVARSRFREIIACAPASTVGVATLLDTWASAVEKAYRVRDHGLMGISRGPSCSACCGRLDEGDELVAPRWQGRAMCTCGSAFKA